VSLDFGSFTRRGLLADHVHPVETWGGQSKQGRGCKTRMEMVEDRVTCM